jgi:glyoxylase-like metal-dependent hydrolase (beta-lactamase superfamily II)
MSDTGVETAGAGPPVPLVRNEPVEIADGVWVMPDGGVPLVPNIGIVEGKRSTLVVDTGMGIRSGEVVLGHARRIADGRQLILTITHFHPEHGYGAQVFAPVAAIVYNRTQLQELHAKGYPYAELFRTFGDTVAGELEAFELVEPDVVYDGEADLDLGARIVQLRTYGSTHTQGDQFVYLPEERILFTGDLVENKGFAIFPYFPPDDVDVNGDRWIEMLEWMERLEPAVVVPGHGDVGDAAVVTAAREYLVRLRLETKRLAAEGVGIDDIVVALETEMQHHHPDWVQPEWIGLGARSFHAGIATG